MTRPWVSPQQVKEYTDIAAVKERPDAKLSVDIARAEQYVINYTHNDFSDIAYATTIPDEVKYAVIMLAEAYANQAIVSAKQADIITVKKGMKSETYDDYSYSIAETTAEVDIAALNLSSLLDGYVLAEAKGKIIVRMRKI